MSLRIYDATGRVVKSFSLPTSHLSNSTSVAWEGTNNRGKSLAAGVYFAELKIAQHRLSTKIILLE
ncbi:T9SS type A sorting domain-containing protein [candidate division WOR-3 bacterium]|nr:T9SS type A sorting domain-containing protein [candidate division WOR-3 bacterium]